jgi:small-conductance mechanosensitive channel
LSFLILEPTQLINLIGNDSSDLEAASKARSKLTSSSSSADNKTISELHAQLIQLEGLSEHLPALTHRLQQLAHLHVGAANFSSRLTQSEESLAKIQGSLANLELSLTKVEQSMVENVLTMDANLKKLEERLG